MKFYVFFTRSVSIKWYQGTGSSRKEITPGTAKYTFSDSNRVLVINSVTLLDAGVYECEGTVAGQAKALIKSTRLDVLGISVFLVVIYLLKNNTLGLFILYNNICQTMN